MKTALLISTYNWPDALELIFLSIIKQTKLPDEILIADDGSDKTTLDLINKFKNILKTPIIHIWHKDDGFQKSQILNKTIAKSSSDYIIQIDGDCILHKNFIEDHITKSQQNCYLYGSRVNIQKKQIDTLYKHKKINFHPFSKGIKKRGRALRLTPISNLYKPHSFLSKKYRGCNTSFLKKDFIKINGYDENFTGWGKEDSELALRFHNIGLQAKRLKHSGILYHIWHTESSKNNLENNIQTEEETISLKKKRCINGIDKYLNEK